jgi:hypothetical protein
MSAPPKPTPDAIKAHLDKWQTLENYRLQEQSLSRLFSQLCPANAKIEDILLKVTALNQFYSTNIYDTYTVSKHILGKAIDTRLRSGDMSLVNELALVTIGGKRRNFYSFASKYCSHHFPDHFPIYDYFVERMLLTYANTDHFAAFRKPDLKSYDKFVQVISDFRTFYSLSSFSLRQIDVFLWLAGKDAFPRTYGTSRSKGDNSHRQKPRSS